METIYNHQSLHLKYKNANILEMLDYDPIESLLVLPITSICKYYMTGLVMTFKKWFKQAIS